ncbi:MAG: hypothetical protein JWP12_378 [Bacteroidetes bacterium]|nr:hypothetical protein [Bacteroidota bacterium]
MNQKLTYLFLFVALLLHFTATAVATDTIYKKRIQKESSDLREKMFLPPLVIKTCPTAILSGGVVPFTAEYRLMMEITSGKRQSEQLAVSYLGKSLFVKAVENLANIPHNEFYKINGWRVQYEHKFYWIGRRHYAPYGFYFAPMVSYANARISIGLQRYYNDIYYDFRNFNIDGVIGVQAGKINRLTIDIYAGLGYKSNKLYYHSGSRNTYQLDTEDFGDIYNSHLNAVAGINLGYSF